MGKEKEIDRTIDGGIINFVKLNSSLDLDGGLIAILMILLSMILSYLEQLHRSQTRQVFLNLIVLLIHSKRACLFPRHGSGMHYRFSAVKIAG